MKERTFVKKNLYYDSFSLMRISAEVKLVARIKQAMVCMGTDLNKEFLRTVGLMTPEAEAASTNDLVIAVQAESEEAASEGVKRAEDLLKQKEGSKVSVGAYRPRTVESAVRRFPAANLALISLPGQFVLREAETALRMGLHLMIFSDNVPMEDELKLKRMGKKEGLLVMGPDCGTAIIHGTPLGFANSVRRGSVGIVGASGTGIQEVSVILSKAGAGVSQAIGTGGRDLSEAIGGITTRMAFEALSRDAETEVIVLIAKSYDERVASEVLASLKRSKKPAVVHLMGSSSVLVEEMGLEAGETLEDTALKAAVHVIPKIDRSFLLSEGEIIGVVESETKGISPCQRFVRGLFGGGSYCVESLSILKQAIGRVYSNVHGPFDHDSLLPDPRKSIEHSLLDLGDDVFTRGRAHPMIDPRIRIDRLCKEAEDPEVAVILLDIVLGYGAHPDMAGALLPAITEAKAVFDKRGGYLSVIVNLCGTQDDPQNFTEQEEKLRCAGLAVVQTNALASRLAMGILKKHKELKGVDGT